MIRLRKLLTGLAFVVFASLLRAQEGAIPTVPAVAVSMRAKPSFWYGNIPQHVSAVFGPIHEKDVQHAYVYIGKTTPNFCVVASFGMSNSRPSLKLNMEDIKRGITLVDLYHQESDTAPAKKNFPPLDITMVNKGIRVKQVTMSKKNRHVSFNISVGSGSFPWKEGVYRIGIKVDLAKLGMVLSGALPRTRQPAKLISEPRNEKQAVIALRRFRFVAFKKDKVNLANLAYFEAENLYGMPPSPALEMVLKKYNQAYALFPNDGPTGMRVSGILRELGRWDEAARCLARLLTLVKSDSCRRKIRLSGSAHKSFTLMTLNKFVAAYSEIARNQKLMADMNDGSAKNIEQVRGILLSKGLSANLKTVEFAYHALLGLAIETAQRLKAKQLVPTLLRFCSDELPGSPFNRLEKNSKYRMMGKNVLFRDAAWRTIVQITGIPADRFDPDAPPEKRKKMLKRVRDALNKDKG